MKQAVNDLELLIRTRHPLVRIETLDEEHAVEAIAHAAGSLRLSAYTWSVTEGLRLWQEAGQKRCVEGTEPLAGAMAYISGLTHGVFIFRGALRLVADKPLDTRLLRDVTKRAGETCSTLFMIDTDGKLPGDLAAMAVPYEFRLPSREELHALVVDTVAELRRFERLAVELSSSDFERLLDMLRGLTRVEVRQVVTRCLLDDNRLHKDDLKHVLELKRQRIGESGVLDFVHVDDVPRVGGMKNLRNWLKLRRDALSAEAREYGLQPPRGVLLLGVQGCGKSLMARATAAEWKMPLLRLDVGSLYDKFIGESERHLRRALGVAGAMAPCVLWIDEIEKAFASVGSSEGDGGLSRRMFGSLLTWLQDHKEPIFVVATANDVSALPPELMRKGRFDEIFFVDLPDEKARGQILAAHLVRRGRDYRQFDVMALARACEGFSGAELEQAVVSSMYAAFAERREVNGEDIMKELQSTRPLTVTAGEKIAALRAWAAGRCVPAE